MIAFLAYDVDDESYNNAEEISYLLFQHGYVLVKSLFQEAILRMHN